MAGKADDSRVNIRPASDGDRAAIWQVLAPVFASGDSYPLPRDITEEAALDYWLGPAHEVFVAEDEGKLLGTYYMKANQPGAGDHVANCGYVTAPAATGRGIASTMCRHSLDHARHRGFRAMQFNFVVATNDRAVRLWQHLGFDIVGRLPGAFRHPERGFVDALVMFRSLP
ncbi:GNAT family N-acetyltransferase [Marinibaculum pumilum]|uniref:GNAT family N-acetyltransferase n=1 Tax=Marinibaculum pumilum TaxID=1766165 RepID=A0ABV7KW77_9PROT